VSGARVFDHPEHAGGLGALVRPLHHMEVAPPAGLGDLDVWEVLAEDREQPTVRMKRTPLELRQPGPRLGPRQPLREHPLVDAPGGARVKGLAARGEVRDREGEVRGGEVRGGVVVLAVLYVGARYTGLL
jgi:hypothetical protein